MPEVPLLDLRPPCDPNVFDFETTADIPPHVGLIGQDRAVQAIKFGLAIESRGFNICVTGEPGTGRTTAIREYLESFAQTKPPADEWCYVNNFVDPHRPRVVRLSPGKGRTFKKAMDTLVSDAREMVPTTFSSDDFVSRRDEIMLSVQRHRESVFSQLAQRARSQGFSLQGASTGFFLVPLGANGQPMQDQDFGALPQEERERLMLQRDQLMEELRQALKQEQGFDSAAAERLEELQRTIATTVIGSLTDRLFSQFSDFPAVVEYLMEVRRDMIEHVDDFLPHPEPQSMIAMPGSAQAAASPFRKYEVNLLVDCADDKSAIVVTEPNPTPQRLFGRIEKEAMFGAVTTDFTMIRPGSLHRANGGYLVLDFDDIMAYPLSWLELKRTIRTGEIVIEEMGERLGYIETKTVRPEPIPWSGKVVAVAREGIYRALYASDPDFRELFKVKADFDRTIERTVEHERQYAGLISAVTKREGLLPFDRDAVARVVELGVRLAEDHAKLSVSFGDVTDVVREASFWAQSAGSSVVQREHVTRAVDERIQRVNLIEEHVQEAIAKEIIVVDTEGVAIGQVNGLSVMDLGDIAFGQPSRITATAGVGREGVIDLQREAQLGGPIFSKAVLTLQGFLVERYAVRTPITLAARLAFEQNYGMVEGDSATCAETCALLSRLSETPVKQSLAITGSMDQKGEVQAIGGVNQKIEGFYDVCRIRGLTGDQGVVIPASNVQHLMLREDVVEAVKDGNFRIYSVSTIDEAIELLTGVEAGKLRQDGTYPPQSINGRALAKMQQFAEDLRQAVAQPRDGVQADPLAPAIEVQPQP